MKHRKLQIAWSVAWGIVAVLLIALWVRSYWWCDDLVGPLGATRSFYVWSDKGHIGVGLVGQRMRSLADGGPWAIASEWTGDVPPEFAALPWLPTWAQERCVIAPNWSLLLLTGMIATAPWLHWSRRFTTRTLLIATTLVAVGLGLIVWLSRG